MPARSVASLVLLVFALPAFTSCGVLLGAAGQLASDREDDAGRTVPESHPRRAIGQRGAILLTKRRRQGGSEDHGQG